MSGSVKGGDSERRPNVVFILTDDQVFDTLGCYGARVMTPHQDRLAAEGVRLNNAFVTTPACTPSRYGCLTGHYPSRCPHPGFRNKFPAGTQTSIGFNTHLSPDIPSLPRVFKKAGYATGMVGKWHIGEEKTGKVGFDSSFPADIDPRDPAFNKTLARHQEICAERVRACGFDYASRIYWNNPGSYGINALNSHNMEWVTEGALEFIDANHQRPFFLFMAPTLHHVPHPQASLRIDPRISLGGYLAKAPESSPPRGEIVQRVKTAGYCPSTAYCTYLDDGVGAALDKLDEYGLADNTVVILLGDNGVPAKLTLYEGGIHVPGLIRWPEGIPGGQVSDGFFLNLDIVPTLMEICGITPPDEMRLDGFNALPMLQGRAPSAHEELFFECGKTRAVRTPDSKYLAFRQPSPPTKPEERYHGSLFALQEHARLQHPAYFEPDQLYDLADDPQETANLAGEDPKRLLEMQNRMKTWLAEFPDHPFGELYTLGKAPT